MDLLYYLELCANPIRFDPVSHLTNVFFDDSNKQVFAVRSGGATGIVVKGPADTVHTFCMDDRGPIRSIKFSPDMKILAIQRTDVCVEFINFANGQPIPNEMLQFRGKNAQIFGFVWVANKEVAMISNGGIELCQIHFDRRQLKSVKSMNSTVNWFAWCPHGNFALLASGSGTVLMPVLVKQGTITKLPRLEMSNERSVPERDCTLAVIYGTAAILILQPTSSRLVEVVIYMLNGPGLAPRKCHVLRLGHSGRFAINIIDDLVIVHHQATATSLLFDVAQSGEMDPISKVIYHHPIIPGKPLRPFALKLPSISLDGQTVNCTLYSPDWVLFQPNIVIDAKLGCFWYVELKLEPLCTLITDRVRLVEFLLQRTDGKVHLLTVLRELLGENYRGTLLPIIESVFNKINSVYRSWIAQELQNQTATPSTAKPIPKSTASPRVLIDQADMHSQVFPAIAESDHIGKILMLYLQSLTVHEIAAQHDLSKMIVCELINGNHIQALQHVVEHSLISESKPLACFLLSLSKMHPTIGQIALDMLAKLNAHEIIIEVLLGQGKVIDALRLAKILPDADVLPARKFLEAAMKTGDSVIFHSVYMHFVQRNIRLRGSPDFTRGELCGEYVQHYLKLFCAKSSN
ncbi:regulator of MON1-CCZ1 complex isoform X1 [Phlebotomus papatasi]|uniref:regulator of MON1-CCZ1 complex isoform X1 n=1 Tax=Phlebotomus papatasi TaxID=29031 RepID=UPI0024839ED9|nr:regulator of MON1-CCZ1 complex isoform X1 [Phlebotomus papatasi]